MDVQGITQTAQVLPSTQPPPPPPEASAQGGQSVETSTANISSQVSTQVMDMAQDQFEQAASELISSMAAMTGVGSNVDTSV